MPNDLDLSRRSFLAGAVGASFALPGILPAEPVPAPAEPMLTVADMDRLMKEVSNWGRWGKDDQMGTVNLITPAKRKYAVSLVREGITVSMAHNQETEKTPDNPYPLVRVVEAVAGTGPEKASSSKDRYTMDYHGTYYSHMDALCHFCYDHKLYNGFPSTDMKWRAHRSWTSRHSRGAS